MKRFNFWIASIVLVSLFFGACKQGNNTASETKPVVPRSIVVTAKYSDREQTIGEEKSFNFNMFTPVSEVIEKFSLEDEITVDEETYTVYTDNLYLDLECINKISENIIKDTTVYIKVRKNFETRTPTDEGIFKTEVDKDDSSSCIITGYTVEKENLPPVLVIPDTIGNKKVIKINDYIFKDCTEITTLDLSNCISLTTIGEEAFFQCTGITEVRLPASLTKIEHNAFKDCKEIAILDLFNCTLLAEIAGFDGCTGIKTLDLSNCTSLAKIVGFDGCTGIKTLDLSNCTSLTYIDGFSDCMSIKTLDLSSCTSLTYIDGFSDCMSIKTLDLSSCTSLTYINHNVFKNCTGITELKLPDSVTGINIGAFSGCTGINILDLSNCSELTEINGFDDCTGIMQLKLPNSLTKIDGFSKCTGIKTLDLSNCTSLAEIHGFSGCTGIMQLKLPNSLTRIGPDHYGVFAFSGCTGITTLDLSNCSNLEALGYMAFYGCTEITEVTFPASLNTIGHLAFSECPKINKVTFGKIDNWKAYDFIYEKYIEDIDLSSNELRVKALTKKQDDGGYCNCICKRKVTP